MAVYNVEDYIEEAIDSVINQSFDFNKVQLILVDDGSLDNSKEIALKYQSQYPNNILVLSKENGGQASARNYGLKYAKGKYINFLDPDDKLSKDTLNAVYNFYENYEDVDIVSIPMFLFERREGPHILNSKFTNENRVVNLLEDIFYIQLSAPSSFVKKEALIEHTFDATLLHGEDALLLNKILIDNPKYGLIGLNENAYYLYRKRFSNDSTVDKSKENEKFFTHKLIHYFKYLFDYSIEKQGHIPEFIQALVIYELQYLVNKPELPTTFTEEDINKFWNYFSGLIDNIDEKIILNHKFLHNESKNFLMYYKRKDFHVEIKNNQIFLKTGDYVINKLHNHRIHFDFVEFKDGFLNFAGKFTSSCDTDFLQLFAEVKDENENIKIVNASYVEYPISRPSHKKFLSRDWKFVYNFDLKIPLNENKLHSIELKMLYQENDKEFVFPPNIIFKKHCNINELVNYFVKDERIIMVKGKTFYIFPYSYVKLLSLSIKSTIKSTLVSIFKDRNILFMVPYILIYLFLYPFMKNKEIWLFEDRPAIADDNARHLFSYAVTQDAVSPNNKVKKYFVVDKKSHYWDEMLKVDKNIVHFKSFKHKILYLFSDKLISSHVDHVFLNPFYEKYRIYFNTLSTFRKYFLQHGVIQGDVSHWLKKYHHNLSLFVTSADLERDSIINGGYNYDKEIVSLLGLPRYDNLKSDNVKKEILFIPTWRRTLNEYNFIYSDYYKRLNSFLNNNKLKNLLKEKGYKLVFKPHYNLLPFLDFLNIDRDYIKVAEDESYQDLFNKSALMITDYSSVFFDFAYLKKPILYYQERDDYHYVKSYWNYETMGFGEIIKSEDDLVDKIIEYIDNDCQMEDKYKERVDNFFKFKDQNNCKRVYDWILKH